MRSRLIFPADTAAVLRETPNVFAALIGRAVPGEKVGSARR